jgi:lipoprotein-releasing system permease protein
VLGIFTGVLALTVILAVMNGFQLGFIESIVEISSYHIRLEPLPSGASGDALAERVRGLPQTRSALPFREIQAMIRGRRDSQQAAVIRGLPPDALERDRGMAERLEFESGAFDLADPGSIILGAELARRLSLRLGDELSMVSLGGLLADALEDAPAAAHSRFKVAGVFRCGFYEYDMSWAFINIQAAEAVSGPGDTLSLGVKLQNRWQDASALEHIRVLLAEDAAFSGGDWQLRSWRDYNRAFFGALRTEKLLMLILVGLIFIVVGLNIFQAQRRAVLERREEIGLLRALGAGAQAVRLIFVWDGFIIGLTGAGMGLLCGLLVALNVGAFFTLLEGAVNGITGLMNALAGILGGGGPGGTDFAVFSPTIFYIKEIPSRVIPHEALLIFLFGFLSALAAAWFASGKVSRTRPAEVLRYE